MTHGFHRRTFIKGAAGASVGLLTASPLVAARRENPPPGDLRMQFAFPKLLALHTHLRVLAHRRRMEPPEGYAVALARYREQMRQVFDARIWHTMESYIARAESLDHLERQLQLFPKEYRSLDLAPTGRAVAAAIKEVLPRFEAETWPELEAARVATVEPLLERTLGARRAELVRFLYSSLNAEPLPLHVMDVNFVGRYVNTGAETREVSGTYFTVVETGRFQPLELIESVLMMLARIIELEDRGNARGALFLLRQRQGALSLDNPALFPRAVLYWTAGEAVRRLLDPEYVHVARRLEIYQRALRPFMPALEEVWNPYLDGQLGLDEAINAMIARVV